MRESPAQKQSLPLCRLFFKLLFFCKGFFFGGGRRKILKLGAIWIPVNIQALSHFTSRAQGQSFRSWRNANLFRSSVHAPLPTNVLLVEHPPYLPFRHAHKRALPTAAWAKRGELFSGLRLHLRARVLLCEPLNVIDSQRSFYSNRKSARRINNTLCENMPPRSGELLFNSRIMNSNSSTDILSLRMTCFCRFGIFSTRCNFCPRDVSVASH